MRLLALTALLVAPQAAAQAPADRGPLYIGADAPRPAVTVSAGVQSYALGDEAITQVVTPVDAFVPFGGAWAVSVQTAYASVGGGERSDLSGLGDVQLAVSHVRPMGEGGLVASLLVNLPTGRGTLAPDEAETAFILGQGFYGFHLPTLGQGFNVTPGVTYAVPVGDRLSIGGGAAYQVRGPFAPQSNVEADYDPSDEVLLTAGVDAAVGERSSVAVDLAVSLYGEDTWEGETFAPGDALALTVQGRTEVSGLGVRVLGRVRSRPAGEATGPGLRFGADGTVPAQARALAEAVARVNPGLEVGGLVQARYYDASELFADHLVFDLRVMPRVQVSQDGWLVGRLGVALGDVEGFDVGVGLRWAF